MTEQTQIIFNGDCPICSREIAIYRARARLATKPLGFVDLTDADLAVLGIDRDAAARRLHVIERGRILTGVDAFLVLWRDTPGFAWLARMVGLPGVRQVAALTYDRLVAPWLYRRHLRRQKPA